MRVAIIICLLLCAGCSQTSLLTRQDYQTSQQAFLHGDDEDALQALPSGREDGDFITTMERTYLSLIQGKPRLAALQNQEWLQETRGRHAFARDVRMFLQVRTQEDYQPAVYELVWMHLLLGWGYAEQGKYAPAAREARLAEGLLGAPANRDGHFDDPVLRLLLAGIWTMCGQWQEARTEFRSAWALDHSLGWARDLAAREQAPAQLFVVLGGPGPAVEWDPAWGLNPLRTARRVKFMLRGRKSALSMQGAHGLVIKAHLSPDASGWYAGRLAGDGELDDFLQDMAYGGQAAAGSMKVTLIVAGDAVKDAIVGAIGGAMLGYTAPIWGLLGGASSAGSAATSGTGATNTATGGTEVSPPFVSTNGARYGAEAGAVIGGGMGAVEGYEAGTTQLGTAMDASHVYRYVRYLPEYLWVAWTDLAPLAYPVKLRTPLQAVEIRGPTVVNGTAVTLAHLADTYESECKYTSENGSVTIFAPPDASGTCPPQPN